MEADSQKMRKPSAEDEDNDVYYDDSPLLEKIS
jgi:hypothetical protein